MKLLSEKMNAVHSEIRGENYYTALDLERRGEKILKLNTGNPATFGFGMPSSVKTALLENIDQAVGYCDPRGMLPARQAIKEYHTSKELKNISVDDVFVGNGVSEIASIVTSVLLNEGDEVLLPMPCYSLWANVVALSGGVPVYYRCDEKENWNPDTEHIKSLITSKTKAILIINPNNPTGVLYSEETLKEIAGIARENHLIVLSDEIYDRLVFDGKKHISFASIAPDVTVITMNGLSKSHCLCGFRCGWMVLSGEEKLKSALREAIIKMASIRLSANAIMQTIIPIAIKDTAYTENMLKKGGRLFEQRKAAFEALDKIDTLSYVKNDAAFYVFPKIKRETINDKIFARNLLLEKKILIVPGSGFLQNDTYHFRIVLLPEPDVLSNAITHIGEFLSK